MIRSSVGRCSAARLSRRALSTLPQGGPTAGENSGTASNNNSSTPQVDQEVHKPEQFSATIFVPDDVGSLLNLFAVIRETEKRFGRIVEFRCPTDAATNAPGARIFLRFASSSSTATLPHSRDPEKTRFLVPRPRPQDAPILPEGESWADLLPFLEPYRGPIDFTPANRAQSSIKHSTHLRAEISYNPDAAGASPRLTRVDERKVRQITHAMSGFSGFAPTTTLAVQQTQATWKERVKTLGLRPYNPPPSFASSSSDDANIDSSMSSETEISPLDGEVATGSTHSTPVELAASESELVVEEEVELTPEEQRELEERQRQTYLASRFAPAPAPPLRDLRNKAESSQSKAALRRQKRAEKKADIEAAAAAPTPAIKTPTSTTMARQKNAKDADAAKEKAKKASVQRQMKGLITSANRLGKQGSLAQQIAFRAEFGRQLQALERENKALESKIMGAKNRLVQKEDAREGRPAKVNEVGASLAERQRTPKDALGLGEKGEGSGSPKPIRSIRSRILSLFGR